jgi:acyl-[acyl-carrier-protein]-phospholipid O-acyltransferase/long-chain-fatty-acid--[acyl-carrier-protein] ligase
VKEDAPLAVPNPYEPAAILPADTTPSTGIDHSHLPTLNRDPAFWGLTVTQFLGAFNDNLFKQLMLLLAIPVGAAAAKKDDEQWYAMMAFSLPFILFSGFAGYLSDRYSKRTVIVISKVAEIVCMTLGMIGFLTYGITGYGGLLTVLFLMGAQSAFFGPGKYGILPELFRGRDLPRANGIILMTTFLAIIFGTAAAGVLGVFFVDRDAGAADPTRMWLGSLACVAIAVLGTLTSLPIRRTPRAEPNLQFQPSSLWVPPETRQLLWQDRPLMLALVVSCMFWLISGVAMSAVNSLGKVQLAQNDLWTSILTAVIGLGIAAGAVLAGRMCHGRVDFRATKLGAWGILICLVLLSIYLPEGRHLLGYAGSLVVLAILGMSAGMFAIPLQVFLQARPPEKQKGRMIAVMNLVNFIAIFLAAPLYKLFDIIVTTAELPRSPIFAMTAVLILPVVFLYRPKNVELTS